MNTIVQRTAFTVVCGIERNFHMSEQKKKSFAVDMLREMLVEQGVELNEKQLRRHVRWASLKRRLQNICPFHRTMLPIPGILRSLVQNPRAVLI